MAREEKSGGADAVGREDVGRGTWGQDLTQTQICLFLNQHPSLPQTALPQTARPPAWPQEETVLPCTPHPSPEHFSGSVQLRVINVTSCQRAGV